MNKQGENQFLSQVCHAVEDGLSPDTIARLRKMSRCGVGGYTCNLCATCRTRRTNGKQRFFIPEPHLHIAFSYRYEEAKGMKLPVSTMSKEDLPALRRNMIETIEDFFSPIALGMYSFLHMDDSYLHYAPHLHLILSSVGFQSGNISKKNRRRLFHRNFSKRVFLNCLRGKWQRAMGFKEFSDDLVFMREESFGNIRRLESYCSQPMMRHIDFEQRGDSAVAVRHENGETKAIYSSYPEVARIVQEMQGLYCSANHGFYHAGGRGYRERMESLRTVYDI